MPLFNGENGFAIYFIHIPKAGGASVENVLRRGLKMSLHSTKYKDFSFPCSPQHFHSSIVENILTPSLYNNSFTIVRDPIDRFVSEYKYRMDQRYNNGRPVLDINSFVSDVFSKYSDNSFILDNHIRPQVEFIHKDTRIYRFEEGIDNALVQEGFIKKEDVVPHVNNSSLKREFDTFLNADSISDLRNFYKRDYDFFGFE